MFGCFNYATYPFDRRTGEKIRFHSFPKDPIRQKQWIICCRRADLLKTGIQSNRNRLVCSKHFDSTMYNNRADLMTSSLRHNAYPNVVPYERKPSQELPQQITSIKEIESRVKTKRRLVKTKVVTRAVKDPLPSTSFASEVVQSPERQKSPGPPLLERNPLSPQEPSTSSNLKGPYSLRKGKSKQYALMLKGFDISGDEEEDEKEEKTKEEKEELEQQEKKKKEKKEEKEVVVMDEDPYQFKAEDSKDSSISGDSDDSSNSSCVEVVREKVVRPKPEKRPPPETAEEKLAAAHVSVKLDISTSDSSADHEEPEEPEEPVRSRLINGGFTCRRCRAKFPHKQFYLAHRFRQACSRRDSRFSCGECRVPCGHEDALQLHTASHTSWGSSQLCLLCRKVVMWKDLFDHLRAHRFGRFGLADC